MDFANISSIVRKDDPLRRSPGWGFAFLFADKLLFLGFVDLPPVHAVESIEISFSHFSTTASKGAEEDGKTLTGKRRWLEAHDSFGGVR
jgi:hypothetical protein